MVRALAPKAACGDDRVPQREQAKEGKRKCVQTACMPCRRRKSKCDGALPVCSSCSAVYKTECNYENVENSPSSRKRTFEDDANGDSVPQPSTEALSVLAASLKTLPDSEAANLIQKIQGCKDIDALAKSLQATNLAPPHGPSPAPHVSTRTEQSFSLPGGRMAYGKSSGLHFRSRVPQSGRRDPVQMRPYNACTWSSVTSDGEFIRHLLDLYFSWSHPFHPLGSKKLFYKSFEHGDCNNCSPLLVNAVLALACHFSDRPQARTISSDARTAGEGFWAEAKRLLEDAESAEEPSITTPQALAVMSMREISMGRDRAGYGYIRRCMTMAIEMGLHLHLPPHEAARFSAEELHQRKLAFWGCFTVDLAWALCAGRIPSLPNPAIGVDKAMPYTLHESSTWEPYVDSDTVMSKRSDDHISTTEYLYYFSSLSEITSDMLFMYYAPDGNINADKGLDCYQRYQSWYQQLPPGLQITDEQRATLPHILLLHMNYHNCIYQLFGVLFHVRFNKSSIRPQEICKQAAEDVSNLLKTYRQKYTLRRSALMMVHILLWTCMIHLHKLPDAVSARNLVDGMYDLKIMAENHTIALENISIIQEHAERLGKILPQGSIEAVESVLAGTPGPERSGGYRVLPRPEHWPHSGPECDELRSSTVADFASFGNVHSKLERTHSASSRADEAVPTEGPSIAGVYLPQMTQPGSEMLQWASIRYLEPARVAGTTQPGGMLGLSDIIAENDYVRLQRAGFARATDGDRYCLFDAAWYEASESHRPNILESLHPHPGARDSAEARNENVGGGGLANVMEGYAEMMRQQWFPSRDASMG